MPVAATMLSGKLLANGLDVGDLDEIGVDFGGGCLRADFIGGEDHVRTDAFDLLEDVVLAGERNGDNQDDRRGADHHAEAGEKGTHRILPQGLED